ncbi:peroxidase family protein [Sphingomonas mollis]|uniref:Peroxidase n=1 Tax=Sphingomonas mollis TaxID=2795726 RepID=A0ABS0XUB4_9SPHN|nr:heme peroxidase family protein [Sphingomonas sp. BT553]MBJ6123639.1 hypothetical protein [Sphingomonas sp. BT553]
MFADLEGPEFDPLALEALALSMVKKDAGQFYNAPDGDENVLLPAGYTYFGQFVDHDLTLDRTTVGEQEADPEAVENFRTAAMDLDCVYGNGPAGGLVLYDEKAKLRQGTKRIGGKPPKTGPGSVRTQFDQRRDTDGVALIGDPRNDENSIVAQVHQAFVMFHNRIIDDATLMNGVAGTQERFRRASRLARWHYQWIILHDYLKRICQPEIYDDYVKPGIMPSLRLYPKQPELAHWPYMPIEFAAAAYRFGHSMVRPSYALNSLVGTAQPSASPPPPDQSRRIPIFKAGAGELDDLRGFRPIPGEWGIDWGYFLDLPGKAPTTQQGVGTLQPAYRIDTLLVDPLANLVNPDLAERQPIEKNLAYLNLLRGSRLRLPTAEQIAEAMHIGSFAAARFPFLSPEQIWSAGSRNAPSFDDDADDEGLDAARAARRPLRDRFAGATPLWYYILREAEWYGTWQDRDDRTMPHTQRGADDMFGGHHLGPIGSAIVLETFLGLLIADQSSFIHQAGWRPMRPIAPADESMPFELKHLVQWALA